MNTATKIKQSDLTSARPKTDPGRPANKGKVLRRISRLAKMPKQSVVKGDVPELEFVDPISLFVDETYQRNITTAGIRLIERMVTQWEWAKYKPPVVTKVASGAYVVVDGQHTATAAASHPNIDKIPVFIVSAGNAQEQARAFIGHNKERVGMSTLQIHRARVTAQDEQALMVEDILGAGGIAITGTVGSSKGHEPNTTMAINAFYWLLRNHGKTRGQRVARVLGDCFLRPIRDQHIKAVAHLLYADETMNLIKAEHLTTVITSEHDGKTLGEAKQQSIETGMAQWECLALIYTRRYQDMYG